MKKFLHLLLLALAIPAIAANPDFYLTGSFNGWKPDQASSKFRESGGVYTLFMPSLSGDFKITTSNWELQYGCASKIKYGEAYPVVQSNDSYNIELPDNPAKDVFITFDYNKKTIKFEIITGLYLVGDCNDWIPTALYQFTYKDGLYTLSTPVFSGKFKIVTSDGKRSFGAGKALSLGAETVMPENGGNMSIDASNLPSGIFVITINPESLLAAEPEQPSEPTEPSEPEQPEEPGDQPSDPSEPAEPSEPEQPEDPGDQPSDPSDPSDPEEPSDPAEPEQPADPGDQPTDPSDPSDSEEPSQPEEPSDPSDPSDEENNAVDAITIDEEALARYYNLSGFPVAHPSGGLFIKVTPSKTEKIFIP